MGRTWSNLFGSSALIFVAALPTYAVAQAGVETEIVVTAERRESSVQRTPQAIQAVNGAELVSRGVTNASDLATIAPNVHFQNTGAQTTLFIRGAGSGVSNQRADPASSYSIDGVAIVRPMAINGSFYDLDRVEILQGPQGTLYGRNATVGAINVLTRRPVLGEHSGAAGLTVGDYNLIKVDGAINVPLGPDFAVRASFQTHNHDGYLTSGASDAQSVAARINALWEPNDKTSVLLTASHFKDTGDGASTVPLKGPGGALLNPSNPWYVPNGPENLNNQVPKDAAYQELEINLVAAQIDIDLGPVTATIIPGYVDTQYEALSYQAGFRQNYDTPDRQISVEARLASNGDGPLQWVAGVYWLDDHQNGISDVGTSLASLSRRAYDKLDLTSLAAFAQATYAITPEFRVVGGIRYTADEKSMDGLLYNVSRTDRTPLPGTIPIHIFGDKTFYDTSYKAGVEYDIAPEHLLYANMSTGYKAGGFNAGTPPNTYEPETIKAYTAGSKNTFFERRVVLNVEGWYWDYENVNQFQFGLANAPPGVTNVQLLTYGAAKLISKGVELQSQFAVGENGRLTANIAYTDSTFDDFRLPAFVFGPFNIAASNFSGRQSTSAPRWSENIGYQHRFPLERGDAVVADVSTQIQSSEFLTVAAVPGVQQPGRSVTDASLTYQAPEQRWQIQAWVKNIEDEPVWAWGGNGPAGLWADPGAPRTYGVTARANF